ncbi:hypothetical protein QBC44DRAFT_334267 [Cladorrhinum sp. PSN332]|nr:hypothetical protein QBC44DRAFT_334267 [Cladorrhinum sp. PSN332]
MKLSAIILAITTGAGMAIAAPAPGPTEVDQSNLDKRATYRVYVAEHWDFQGRTELLEGPAGECRTLGNGWPNVISSFGPDPGFTCTIYDDNGCFGANYGGIRYPGYNALSTIGWNDRINSFRCYQG